LRKTVRVTAEAELRAAVQRRADALAGGSPQALESLLHSHFRWTSHRGERQDREAYVRANLGGRLRWIAQHLDAIDVVVVGDAGVVTCIANDQVEVDGEPHSLRMPVTQTWVRTPDGWRCLAGHAGPPL
jgi:ketosteroid isomerase-like protein